MLSPGNARQQSGLRHAVESTVYLEMWLSYSADRREGWLGNNRGSKKGMRTPEQEPEWWVDRLRLFTPYRCSLGAAVCVGLSLTHVE